VNTEELELSLRAEFENYLKGVIAEMRADVSDFQKNFEAEFDKHRVQMDEAFQKLTARFESNREFDRVFSSSVVEHLRLARDEGAQVAATAFGEAEKLKEETSRPASYDLLRDAVNEISRERTQASILQALVKHATNFTPRGAFFIVRNDHLIGWKLFGEDGSADESAIANVRIPLSENTLLAEAISSLSTCDGVPEGHEGNQLFLEPLGFGRPDRMYAVPLTARGRGVAVLYADYGKEGAQLNVEALESLVRVAGLTVELLAASQSAVHVASAPAVEPAKAEETVPAEGPEREAVVEASGPQSEAEPEVYTGEIVEEVEAEVSTTTVEYANNGYEAPVSYEAQQETPHKDETAAEYEYVAEASITPEVETSSEYESVAESYDTPEVEIVEEASGPDYEVPSTEFAFGSSDSYDASPIEEPSVEPEPFYEPEPEVVSVVETVAPAMAGQPVVEVAGAQPVKTRFSDRNLDLPIEVSDDERRLHNDARRFARLLVSEIKLYNEQKVAEGREANDLYDRLREAIDRSREMYEKRVQPAVASKFDYFDYEIVSSLAEGDASKLGSNYPGSNN
jgi:hypothetical protein